MKQMIFYRSITANYNYLMLLIEGKPAHKRLEIRAGFKCFLPERVNNMSIFIHIENSLLHQWEHHTIQDRLLFKWDFEKLF